MQCLRGAAAGLADQYDGLSLRETGRVELRQRMIEGTRDMAALEFMGFADINQNTRLFTQRLYQFVVFDGRHAR
jgi:hypothetical protein